MSDQEEEKSEPEKDADEQGEMENQTEEEEKEERNEEDRSREEGKECGGRAYRTRGGPGRCHPKMLRKKRKGHAGGPNTPSSESSMSPRMKREDGSTVVHS